MDWTMQVALLTEIGKPLVVDEVRTTNLLWGQVYVRILVSGICGAQLQEIDGHKQSGPLPHPLGHEACGIVEQIGAGVTTVNIGDKVVCHWRKGEGLESDFPKYIYKDKEITSGKIATFGEYMVLSENRVTSVPQDTPDEFCALLGCGLSTALGTIEQEAKLLMGESVLIIGCGGLGLNLILAAKMRQAGLIIAMDTVPDKERAAREMGAHDFHIDLGMAYQFDVIIDTSGNSDAISGGTNHLKPSGRFIMVGLPKELDRLVIFGKYLFEGEGKTIKATQGGGFQPAKDIPRYIALYNAGLLKLDGIVSHRIKLSAINQGIDLVRNGQAGRIMLDCEC